MSSEASFLPMVDSAIAVTIELRPADEAMRMLLAFDPEDQQSVLELIVIGDKQYSRVNNARRKSPWLVSRFGTGEPALIDAMGAADLLDDMIPDDELAPIVAVGVEDCGDGRQCFVLTSPEDTSVQLLVDTETYLPVVFRGRGLGEDLGREIELRMEWNAEVAIGAPAVARQIPPDEFAHALVNFLFITQVVAHVPAAVVVTRPSVEVPVEAVIVDERTALWLELGASLYGEALDNAGDLFHGDPGITAVRFDPTIDIRRWGVGVVELADPTARELFGPDGAFPCGSADPVVACGADGVSAGSYLLVWIALLEPVPLDDAEFVRSYWAVFQDGDPGNDWVALPQFPNDVLDGSDTHYRLEATPDGWVLARTFGPQLEPMRTTGAAMILEDIVVFLIPEQELPGLELSLGVASFSGPVSNPFGVGGALDRSPDVQQPLTPLGEVGF